VKTYPTLEAEKIMPKAQLLLVEDDSALAELVRWHFEREEFDVQHTGDGEEALLMARERTPDLVLLDWMLENLSGIEVCRQLRKADNTANVPIIMLTARGEEDDRIRGLEIGADESSTAMLQMYYRKISVVVSIQSPNPHLPQ
jgi:two-component system phosphate regulon response regulator PhoB